MSTQDKLVKWTPFDLSGAFQSAKISIEDVIQIRTLYKEGKSFAEVYSLYEDRLSYSGFQQCWRGKTWPEIMPEVY